MPLLFLLLAVKNVVNRAESIIGICTVDDVPDARTIWKYRQELTRCGAYDELFRLKKCRKFYQIYSANKIEATLSPQLTIEDSGYSVAPIQKTATSQKLDSAYPFTLSWSHYVVLMRMESAD